MLVSGGLYIPFLLGVPLILSHQPYENMALLSKWAGRGVGSDDRCYFTGQ